MTQHATRYIGHRNRNPEDLATWIIIENIIVDYVEMGGFVGDCRFGLEEFFV